VWGVVVVVVVVVLVAWIKSTAASKHHAGVLVAAGIAGVLVVAPVLLLDFGDSQFRR
jgi:hypothetical protein